MSEDLEFAGQMPGPREGTIVAQKRLVREWLKEHPERAAGRCYVVFSGENWSPNAPTFSGASFYEIQDGKVYASAAVACIPGFFERYNQMRREEDEHRKRRLKHPQCPSCYCTREAPHGKHT